MQKPSLDISVANALKNIGDIYKFFKLQPEKPKICRNWCIKYSAIASLNLKQTSHMLLLAKNC